MYNDHLYYRDTLFIYIYMYMNIIIHTNIYVPQDCVKDLYKSSYSTAMYNLAI